MTDIVEFLRARYGDAKDQVRRDFPGHPQAHLGEISEAAFRAETEQRERLLGELDAKLALLDEHPDVNDGDCGTCVNGRWGYPTHGGSAPQRHPCRTLRLLAVPFSVHPDYDERWRP